MTHVRLVSAATLDGLPPTVRVLAAAHDARLSHCLVGPDCGCRDGGLGYTLPPGQSGEDGKGTWSFRVCDADRRKIQACGNYEDE